MRPRTGPGPCHGGDDAIVVAESLGSLAPLKIADATVAPLTAAVVPSA